MTVIKSGTNSVVTEAPEPDDLFVQVNWYGPDDDGRTWNLFGGLIEPVENYDEVVAWAVSMAKYMAHKMYVLPMTGAEYMRRSEVHDGFAKLDHQARGRLRQVVISRLAQIMRDSPIKSVRADAYEVLVQMKVVAIAERVGELEAKLDSVGG